ncbi:Peroxidase 4 [Linum perenne]
MAPNTTFCIVLLLAACSAALPEATGGKLSPGYYWRTCPVAPAIVEAGVAVALKIEPRMGASLLRLHFHDCFVNGCDASNLLDDNATFVGEKTASPNANSARGYEVIDEIKARVEEACPGIVSCADILALAAKDSVVYLGGPWWEVGLGRRDSVSASKAAAEESIPRPTFNLSDLAANFWAHGLSFRDMVALSGAHTIGMARCTTFRDHIYNDSDIDPLFAKWLQSICPPIGWDDVLAPLDYQTPIHFDNSYYVNLVHEKGLLHSDQELYNGDDDTSDHSLARTLYETRLYNDFDKMATIRPINENHAASIVRFYVDHPDVFFEDFGVGMIKMGEIMPLTGNEGEIRKNCRKAN